MNADFPDPMPGDYSHDGRPIRAAAYPAGEQPRSVADTIAQLRFQENVYQTALEVGCRAVSILNLFDLTN